MFALKETLMTPPHTHTYTHKHTNPGVLSYICNPSIPWGDERYTEDSPGSSQVGCAGAHTTVQTKERLLDNVGGEKLEDL